MECRSVVGLKTVFNKGKSKFLFRDVPYSFKFLCSKHDDSSFIVKQDSIKNLRSICHPIEKRSIKRKR